MPRSNSPSYTSVRELKRVRGGGGARDQLRDEGIVIFGDYAGDQVLAAAPALPR